MNIIFCYAALLTLFINSLYCRMVARLQSQAPFGVCGFEVTLKTNGLETRNMLGNIMARVPKTSSDIPCGQTVWYISLFEL